MKKSSISWSVKQFTKMFTNGKISFDYPIQREGNQWDLLQKSDLIHSCADDYPIPPIYSIKEDNIYYILDGKQRLTTLISYVTNGWATHENMETVNIDGKDYSISECLFEELHEEVRDSISDTMILNYTLDEYTDEDIERMFLKLNNGTALTKIQKAKSIMGTEWATKIKELVTHPFVQENTNFTASQIKSADNETAIIQTMMLLDDNYELKTISSNHVFDYTHTFKEDSENKFAIADKLLEVFTYINTAYTKFETVEEEEVKVPVKEKVLSKKVNFPMFVITAKKAMDSNIPTEEFVAWANEFKLALKEKSENTITDYKEFGGQGSVKKDKTLGRLQAMETHFNEYFIVEAE
uniref:GmrSD restriction endonucleases N-terminal domain-containing protein n=1 Tax=Aeromonas sp. Ne-1 TaxID=1675689 RepID=A0A0H4JBW8_9GAMM|nr:DUF262 domain-containing protein [Aeromonas sp. Ne-1]AKO69674.1 hypothetical protein [Aeromonas sp. Ne-1]